MLDVLGGIPAPTSGGPSHLLCLQAIAFLQGMWIWDSDAALTLDTQHPIQTRFEATSDETSKACLRKTSSVFHAAAYIRLGNDILMSSHLNSAVPFPNGITA